MEKKFEVLPPIMPNYVRFRAEPGLRQDGFKVDEGFPIENFTEQEAYEYAELMKNTFINHWRKRKNIKI